MYGSLSFTADGNVGGTPEGSRKLEITSPDGKTATVPATAGDNYTFEFAADIGIISPSGLGARLGVGIADAPFVDRTTTDAEAMQAGAKAGDYATVVMRSSVYRLKLHLTYTLDLSQRLSVSAGSGLVWSRIDYCSAPAQNGHLVGSGNTEHDNHLAACAAPGFLQENRFGVNSLVEGTVKLWGETSLVTGAAYTIFPSMGSTWSAFLGFRLSESL